MSFADQLATAIAGAALPAMHDISRALWKALEQGLLSDDEAQRLAELIHARRKLSKACESPQRPATHGHPSPSPKRRVQPARAHPERILRRRRLALSGPLPSALRALFTTGELAVLRIVADEVGVKGCCDRSLAEIAARAGVCRSLAYTALRQAERHGLISITERRRPGRLRNLTNLVHVISREWKAWLKTKPCKGFEAGVFRKLSPTDERVSRRDFSGPLSADSDCHRGYRRGAKGSAVPPLPALASKAAI